VAIVGNAEIVWTASPDVFGGLVWFWKG